MAFICNSACAVSANHELSRHAQQFSVRLAASMEFANCRAPPENRMASPCKHFSEFEFTLGVEAQALVCGVQCLTGLYHRQSQTVALRRILVQEDLQADVPWNHCRSTQQRQSAFLPNAILLEVELQAQVAGGQLPAEARHAVFCGSRQCGSTCIRDLVTPQAQLLKSDVFFQHLREGEGRAVGEADAARCHLFSKVEKGHRPVVVQRCGQSNRTVVADAIHLQIDPPQICQARRTSQRLSTLITNFVEAEV
mmetsp:Transcript_67446/g.124234  ORF Transcript_67446/g.124234 Transcript_67446/m.124234 type:complete len:252 (-) Transcript_67446:942-1697(-)